MDRGIQDFEMRVGNEGVEEFVDDIVYLVCYKVRSMSRDTQRNAENQMKAL